MTRSVRLALAAASLFALTAPAAHAAPAKPAAPALAGVYEVAPGRKGQGDPETVHGPTKPFSEDAPVSKVDPARLCQPVGPFRMMARADLKFELVPTHGAIVVLFQDISHGYRRTIHLDRGHLPKAEPSWQGDSVGHWENGALVDETTGFNDYTWLNSKGVRHSDGLRLVERFRPLPGGGLEYRATATDPKALKGPATYVRYFRAATSPIAEDVCEIDVADLG